MSLLARPVVSALAIFLLTLMLLKEVAFKRALDAVGDRAAQGFTQPFHLTGQALGLTLLLAAQWAAVLWFLGWHLSTYSDSTAFAASVGSAMQTVAATLLTLEFLRRMFRPQGLAAAHFRWRDARLLTIRRHLRWFELLALPAVFLFALTADSGSEAYASSLGRLLLIGLLLLVGAFLAIVLRRRPSLQSAHAAEHSVARRDRTTVQTAAYLCAVGLPILLAVFTGAGYLYTATLLTTKLLQSIWLAVLLLVLHATALRWLYHARGRLALERIRAAQAANSEDDAAGDAKPVADESGGPASGMDIELEAPRAADMATINAQTRRLLKIVVAGGAVLGAWMIWADVIPALRFLDFALWSTQIETTRMVPGPDGTQVPEPAVRIRVFTLGHLFTALAVLVVSFLAAGNIPGLLEVGVLQRLPIDSGARYAATSVARYAIYIVGIVTAFNLIGVGWDKVQWLVAALGVGLGFGLQEIVANWVSGIILLFERPLRVGDIVTVGDVTGVVTRIQIRATTIRNWDRKEFIVPNKELITGKLMNWTLSDQTNRVVINIGVAYGSDTERVRRLLQEILDGHPNVSKDPAPMVTFEGFGDSALNFVVRCYLPSLEQRLNTVHDLHHEIHRRFADEGIEIAFPQMDLHLRSDEAHTNGPPSTPATESRPPQRNGTDGEPAVPRAEGKSAG
ncbi:MAG: mechanosensitive ion channel domain-containing protein [Planctomycetaceae bacterium]